MEWSQERTEDFPVVVVDGGSPGLLLWVVDLESLLGLSHYLFSKAFISPMFTFCLETKAAKSSLKKKMPPSVLD